ncbi:hypothetical protein [Acidisoma sp.]|uniref:hypothetical protein n=1 Tax=Acidisoma sp. TaxID=1872115 RepID=UPI003B004549
MSATEEFAEAKTTGPAAVDTPLSVTTVKAVLALKKALKTAGAPLASVDWPGSGLADPVLPVDPVEPVEPVAPVAPVAPVLPVDPVDPWSR